MKLRIPEFQDSRNMKVARLSALRTGRLYPHKTSLILVSVRGFVDTRAIVRLEGLIEWKIPVSSWEIEHATFRHVGQWFHQLQLLYSYLQENLF